jgi:hypothetical protein
MSELTDALVDALDDLLDVLGDSCTYTPATAAAFTLTAIFSRGIMDGQPDTTGPMMMEAAISDFAVTPARGDAITWNTRSYRVLDVREDVELASYKFSIDEVR